MSWGHDEYIYRVLKHNGCTIPAPGLFAIRYHSFYPWHTGGAYGHLTSVNDRAMLPWITCFNQHDLYTKSGKVYNEAERSRLWNSYYKQLCEKYGIGGKLQW
jgi:inositol oxygenase